MDRQLTHISIFSGCGGLSLGLYKSGWKGLFAIEKSPMAFETLKHNLIDKISHFDWPDWLPQENHDINRVITKYKNELISLRGKVTLVAGGPPCQGFSFAGRRNETDNRNKLIDSYIKFIDLVMPEMLFFENVKGFTVGFSKKNSKGKVYSDYVISKIRELGYDVKAKIVDFSEYGIPQKRKRFILIGLKNGNANDFFDKIIEEKSIFLKEKGLKMDTSLKEAISDLKRENGEILSRIFRTFKEGIYSSPTSNYQKLLRKDAKIDYPDSHRFSNHNKETRERFEFILENCKRNSTIPPEVKERFKLRKRSVIPLAGDIQSPTLTTLPDDFIHYSEPRILTVREYARIQSFDDWFEFKGNYTTGGKFRKVEVPRYTQIGNAVPPLFAELSGRVLRGMSG